MTTTLPTTEHDLLGDEGVAKLLEADGYHDLAVVHRLTKLQARDLFTTWMARRPEEFTEARRRTVELHVQAEARVARRTAGAR